MKALNNTNHITAQVVLRPIEGKDFAHMELGEVTILARQRFFVRTGNNLECYTLAQYSDKQLVKDLIAEGRVYVLALENLAGTTAGTVVSETEKPAA